MIIRGMRSGDRHAVFEKACSLAATHYPYLRPEVDKISKLIVDAMYNGFALVAERDGKVGAALLARTGPNLWGQRNHATVLLWYSDVPGAGAAMLRKFRDWVRAGRTIRLAGFVSDSEAVDPSALRLAERIGFTRKGTGGYYLVN